MPTSPQPLTDVNPTQIFLCGGLDVGGRRVDEALPGRQGQLLIAYLALHHPQPVGRDELVLAIWTDRPPADPRGSLSVLLTRVRRALGPGLIEPRSQLALGLDRDAVIDLDSALSAVRAAEAALARGGANEALALARSALSTLAKPLLPGLDAPFLEEPRRRAEEQRARALEALGEAALRCDPAEPRTAEHAAVTLVQQEPFRESGYALLMRCQAAAGNVAEALRTFDRLRVTLREELGMVPSAAMRELADGLLRAGEPQRAFTPTRLPRPLRSRPAGPLCGRDAEFERLQAWWAAPGHGVRVCRVSGDAGIGKTRLACELAQLACGEGARVLYGRCEEDMPVPYQPFVESIRQLVADAGHVEYRPELAAELAELARLVPELRSKLDGAIAEDPQLRRYRVFEAVVSLLSQAAKGSGVLLILDDLHLADEPTAALLRHLLRVDVAGRLAIVAAHRTPDLAAGHPIAQVLTAGAAERIALRSLDAEAVARLFVSIAGRDASPDILDVLSARAGGNPLFVEEILLELRSSGDLSSVGVPETVQVLLARRLARLGPEVGAVLADAAAIGPEFDIALLEALEGPARDTLSALEVGLESGLVIEVRNRQGRLAFAHGLVRDAIYAQHSAVRRPRVHGRLARLLEDRADLRTGFAELARHWREAGEPVPELGASLAAAAEARDVGAFAEALRHYQRALELHGVAGDACGEDEGELLEAAAEAARWAGKPSAAADMAQRAIARASNEQQRARLNERLGRYLWEAGRWDESLAAYDAAVTLLKDRPRSVESARALAGQAAVLMLRERFSASLDRALEALDVARAVGARRVEGHALNTYGVDLGISGRVSEGVAALRTALSIAEEVNNLEDSCRAYCNLAELLTRAGQTREAADVALEGYRFARRHGLERSGAPIVATNAVSALLRLGRWDEAEQLADESLSDALGGDDENDRSRGATSYLRAVRASLHAVRGETERARAEIVAVQDIIDDAFEPALVVELASARLELALSEGDRPAACAAVRRGFAALDHDEDGELTLRLCALGLRALERSHPWVDELAGRAEALIGRQSARDSLHPEARAYALMTQAEVARLSGEPASGLWAAAARAWDTLENAFATAQARLAQGLALIAEGQVEPAVDALEAAAKVAADLGAEPLRRDVERALRELSLLPGAGTR